MRVSPILTIDKSRKVRYLTHTSVSNVGPNLDVAKPGLAGYARKQSKSLAGFQMSQPATRGLRPPVPPWHYFHFVQEGRFTRFSGLVVKVRVWVR